MKIYDTLSGDKKELKQPKVLGIFKKPINIFVCGPTVYDYPHVGNARTFVMFDMFVRYLRSQNMKVKYLQNITDIDDKIIQKAKDEKKSWQEVSKLFEDIYHANLKSLGVDTENMEFARATDHIPEIIAQVKRLRDKGFAYKIDNDGWYFDITKYSGYGELAHRTVQQAEDGVTRVDNSDKKRNAGDFCLWKLSDEPTLQLGDDGLGAGRPGWHIEDTAITEKVFGPQYDIHGGAIDLKFPHHEAERAQQESASGKKPFVNIWMHAGFLTINGQKMSKSLGNFMTVDDMLKKMTTDEFRMMLLRHHYSNPINFNDELIHSARKAITQLEELLWKLERVERKEFDKMFDEEIAQNKKDFFRFMDDDFNTAGAMAALGIIATKTHRTLETLGAQQAKETASFLKNTFAYFGINLESRLINPAVPIEQLPENIKKLLKDRELSRANKQFAQSDALRAQIEQLGYVVEDTPNGPLVLPKASE